MPSRWRCAAAGPYWYCRTSARPSRRATSATRSSTRAPKASPSSRRDARNTKLSQTARHAQEFSPLDGLRRTSGARAHRLTSLPRAMRRELATTIDSAVATGLDLHESPDEIRAAVAATRRAARRARRARDPVDAARHAELLQRVWSPQSFRPSRGAQNNANDSQGVGDSHVACALVPAAGSVDLFDLPDCAACAATGLLKSSQNGPKWSVHASPWVSSPRASAAAGFGSSRAA